MGGKARRGVRVVAIIAAVAAAIAGTAAPAVAAPAAGQTNTAHLARRFRHTWGLGGFGSLGDGTTADRHSPAPVPGLTGIKQVAAGEYMGYALRSDGTLFAWGSGYLGNGATSSPTPVAVPLAGVTQVATSGADTLAIAGPGATVYAWGVNFGGEIGDGTQYVPRATPVQLNLSGITQVAEGLFSSEAVRSDGSLFGWGPNGLLELGIGGNPGNQLVPVQNIYLSNVSKIALGRVSQIVDITCEYIGEVKTQTPAAGTLARLGTAVSIGIGKPGGKCL